MTALDRLDELINLVIDREATERQRLELTEALQSVPELPRRYEELQSLTKDLDSFQAIQPPARFSSLVMSRIRDEAPAQRGRSWELVAGSQAFSRGGKRWLRSGVWLRRSSSALRSIPPFVIGHPFLSAPDRQAGQSVP